MRLVIRKVLKWIVWLGGAAVCLAFLAFLIAFWRSTNECYDGTAVAPVHPMKAVTYCDYGTSEVMRYGDVEKPIPGDDQLLVRVRAASLNPLDWHYMRGTPCVMRLGAGLRRPKVIRLGTDFAGTVESIGKNVTLFKPGDEVFGMRTGAFAQYVVIRQDSAVARKPASLTFEQAAAIPVAALTALQGLRDKGNLQPGQKVLINGASGGVGTFMVQIAKSLGADVTGVCSGRNAEMVRSLGADRVIDYTKEDFVQGPQRYDLVLDNVGTRPVSDFVRVLNPAGVCILIGGGGPDAGGWMGPLGRLAGAYLLSPFRRHKVTFMIANGNQQDLTTLGGLMESGKVTAVIDRTYRLSEVPAGIDYLEAGHARGKVIITVE